MNAKRARGSKAVKMTKTTTTTKKKTTKAKTVAKTGPRIIAKFHPQVWVNDYAMDVDPQGPVEWDATDAILAMPREEALKIQDCQYESDALHEEEAAPEWIRDWSGPFYVTVEESIRAFFGVNAETEAEVSS